MRVGSMLNGRNEFDEIFQRLFDEPRTRTWSGGYEVPTEIFHTDDRLTIRLDLPGVSPDDVEVSIQENVLVVNGTRRFPYDADKVRFLRRGTFYGDFTQRVTLGKGLNTDEIKAHYENGVLELTIPYAEEVQPRKIAIEVGDKAALSN